MKALSLTQPWATLVAIGAKKIESRSWQTSYRGAIAIHAAKGFPVECQDLCDSEPFYPALEAAGFYRYFKNSAGHGDRGPWSGILPRGVVIATARLIGCVQVSRIGTCELPTGEDLKIDELERSFGDYAPGRFAWLFADVVKLPTPIPARGYPSLWDWTENQ